MRWWHDRLSKFLKGAAVTYLKTPCRFWFVPETEFQSSCHRHNGSYIARSTYDVHFKIKKNPYTELHAIKYNITE
jgi:hypothetical protein